MALRGSLDDVPLVDVLQFVHLSGKSGTLALTSHRGAGWIEVANGNVVFARGPKTPNLGELLVGAGALNRDALDDAITTQRADPHRPPLGRLLVAAKLVTSEQLADCVRKQIHDAMLDLCQWTSGEFQFDQGSIETPDDIRVDVAEVLPELNLNTQFLVLEAVRLLDERRREEEAERATRPKLPPLPPAPRHVTPVLPERRTVDAPLSVASRLLAEAEGPRAPRIDAQPTLPPPDGPAFPFGRPQPLNPTTGGLLLVGFERSTHPIVMQSVARAGYRVLGHVPRLEIEPQLLGARRWPLGMALLWRVREADEVAQRALIARVIERHPGWTVIALVSAADPKLPGRLYAAGARSVIPGVLDELCDDVLDGIVAIVAQVWNESARAANAQAAELRAWVHAKQIASEMQRALRRENIKLELLRVAADSLDRAVLLLCREGRLESLGGFGLTGSGAPIAQAVRSLAVDVTAGSPLARCIDDHVAFLGPTSDLGLSANFFEVVGAPAYDRGVLVPLVGAHMTLGVLYGDNGDQQLAVRGVHAIEIAASQAGIAYENVMLRARLDGTGT